MRCRLPSCCDRPSWAASRNGSCRSLAHDRPRDARLKRKAPDFSGAFQSWIPLLLGIGCRWLILVFARAPFFLGRVALHRSIRFWMGRRRYAVDRRLFARNLWGHWPRRRRNTFRWRLFMLNFWWHWPRRRRNAFRWQLLVRNIRWHFPLRGRYSLWRQGSLVRNIELLFPVGRRRRRFVLGFSRGLFGQHVARLTGRGHNVRGLLGVFVSLEPLITRRRLPKGRAIR